MGGKRELDGMRKAASACFKCRSRSTCALIVGGDAHATYSALGCPTPSSSIPLPPKSVFRRSLPESLTAFSSPRGREMFTEAMAKGHMEPYFPLVEQFVTQMEPTFCGLGTLTMVMNALRIDPRRRWGDETGPGWRWWSDDMFPTSCSGSLESVRARGITMDEFRLLAAANGADIQMHRPSDPGASIDHFRQTIVDAATDSSESFVVTSFCRAALGQTGPPRPVLSRALGPGKIPSGRPPSPTISALKCAIGGPTSSTHARVQDPANASLDTPPPVPDPRLTHARSCQRAGGGHFSPIGGYHEGADAALVLDVARFKYPPYWVPLPKLWDASVVSDQETGRSRGYFVLSAAQHVLPQGPK